MRFYLNNDSYPEMRPFDSPAERWVIWYRAFRSSLTDRRVLAFVFAQVGLFVFAGLFAWAAASLIDRADPGWRDIGVTIACWVPTGAACVVSTYLALSWGGDVVRPHLRAVSSICRDTCPRCGHLLTSQRASEIPSFACPECGEPVEKALFSPPYAIPGPCKAIGGSQREGSP